MSEGAKTKLLNYFLKNVGREVPRLELVQLCRNNGDWTRSLRSLRDLGWIVIYNRSNKTYCFPYSEPRGEPRDRRYIPKDVRARVEIRDVSTCQMCGRSVRNDGITIHIDHIVPLSWGGGTVVDNLQCLCRECNEGKKNWVANESPDLMKEISQATNTIDRLRLYFEYYPNQVIPVSKLSVIAKTRDWTRGLRKMRQDFDMCIKPLRAKKGERKEDGYIYIVEND